MANYYRELSKKMFWSLITCISLLTYVVEIRPFLDSLYGIYYVGLSDGIVTTIIALIVIFYAVSRSIPTQQRDI